MKDVTLHRAEAESSRTAEKLPQPPTSAFPPPNHFTDLVACGSPLKQQSKAVARLLIVLQALTQPTIIILHQPPVHNHFELAWGGGGEEDDGVHTKAARWTFQMIAWWRRTTLAVRPLQNAPITHIMMITELAQYINVKAWTSWWGKRGFPPPSTKLLPKLLETVN